MTDPTKETKPDPWGSLRYFLGRWVGRGSGKPGESQAEREYELVLNEQFIQIRNRSTYEPQEQNPEGEIHEEIGYFSCDRNRQKFILREFHVEGFVNQYVLEEGSPGENVLVFQTEAIENMAPGWRARTTYEILGDNEFRETFDLAGPEKEWSCFITNEFKRVLQGES